MGKSATYNPKRVKIGIHMNDPYVTCDICEFKNLASRTVINWKGNRVCYPECWEDRPAIVLDLPKALPAFNKNELKPIDNTRPEHLTANQPVVSTFTGVNSAWVQILPGLTLPPFNQ